MSDATTEILIVVAKQMVSLVKVIGSENGRLVLPIFIELFSSEDSTVREQTMKSFELISRDSGLKEEDLLAYCRQLSKEKNSYSHISSVMILCKLCKSKVE